MSLDVIFSSGEMIRFIVHSLHFENKNPVTCYKKDNIVYYYVELVSSASPLEPISILTVLVSNLLPLSILLHKPIKYVLFNLYVLMKRWILIHFFFQRHFFFRRLFFFPKQKTNETTYPFLIPSEDERNISQNSPNESSCRPC